MIETKRLILRKMTMGDLDDLHEILSDPESMKHYPKPKTREESKMWIERNIQRYETLGYGLWAIELKESRRFIGDCGITMQEIDGSMKPEIGYHVHKAYTKKGYATEAAKACRDYAFDVLELDAIYSYMKYTNIASSRVAEKNGMILVKEYDDPINEVVKVYEIKLDAYKRLKISNEEL